MPDLDTIEATVRSRLRSLRTAHGWSLDELAERSNLSASVISRIETGKRTVSLDVLLPLARSLQVDLDVLLDASNDDDVVIRPVATDQPGRTTWLLSKPTGSTAALKMRLEPLDTSPDLTIHPGRDWFFVLEGRVRLQLGERDIIVEAGEAAEFATMTPHAFSAHGEPAEVIMLFDRDGHHAHTHSEHG